jgi:hypothetical protein
LGTGTASHKIGIITNFSFKLLMTEKIDLPYFDDLLESFRQGNTEVIKKGQGARRKF